MSEVIIGIDLGTTNSAVGVVESGFPILLANEHGDRITPSVVSYGDEILVGKVALRSRGSSSAGNRAVISSAKRYMGKRFSETSGEQFCVPLVEADNGLVGFNSGHGIVTAIEVSAEILKYLKGVAEKQLGYAVKKAVITVPAYFNDAQRNATKKAGVQAGLEVMRIINEPTAAALAYGLDKLSESTRVVVYDYGGGTFDVSVLELQDGVFQVLTTTGDTQLGGDDLDQIIARWCVDFLDDVTFDDLNAQERQRLFDEARIAKEALTSVEKTRIMIPFFREGINLDQELTVETLNGLIRSEVNRTITFCKQVLLDLDNKTVDKVVLVGGTSRIPFVRESVAKVFGIEPDVSQHPDEAVALGAVIQGGVMNGSLSNITLLDVTPLSLGIETLGGLMNVIIPRNSTIPCKAGEMFTNAVTNQEAMHVRVLQGEREMARDNWELGQVDVSFQPKAKGQARVGVQFSIDENGILEVLARDVQTGADTLLEIDSAAVDVTDDKVEKMVSESVDFAFEDMAERVFTEAQLKAEELLPAVEAGLAQVGAEMEADDLAEIKSAEAAVRAHLQSKDANALKAAVQHLDKMTEHMAAILVEKAMEAALMRKLEE